MEAERLCHFLLQYNSTCVKMGMRTGGIAQHKKKAVNIHLRPHISNLRLCYLTTEMQFISSHTSQGLNLITSVPLELTKTDTAGESKLALS